MDPIWRWDLNVGPLSELQDMLQDVFGEMRGGATALAGRFGRMELRRTERGFLLFAALPGAKREDVELSVEGRTVMIEGTRPGAEVPPGAVVHRRERLGGSFQQSLDLPEAIDTSRVTAKMRNGVLQVELPRIAEAQPREIKIEVEEQP